MKKSPLKVARRIEQTLWNKYIKLRADSKCELCGNSERQLHAHHIEGKSSIALRLAKDSGICLCSCCHMDIHGTNGLTLQKQAQNRLKDVRSRDFLEKLQALRTSKIIMKLQDVERIRDDLKEKLEEMTT